MINKTLKRKYIFAIAVFLFAAVVSVTVCALHASNEAEVRKMEEAHLSVPITVTVRGVVGEYGYASGISSWTSDLFTGKNPVEIITGFSGNNEPTQVSLSEYLKDVRIKMSKLINRLNGSPVYRQQGQDYPNLIGITSIPSDEQLLPENGCKITWYEGYDESVFGGDEPVCLIPEGKIEDYDNGTGKVEVYFYISRGKMDNGVFVETSRMEYECTLKIVGTYSAGDEVSIYCPLSIIEQVYEGLEESRNIDSISATLADNRLLDEFREKASYFYSNLSQNSEEFTEGIMVRNRSKTFSFSSDNNAMDIIEDDSFDPVAILENSIKFKRTVAMIVVAVAAVVGLLVGSLMICCRKSDIAQMRADGKATPKIYFGFVLEQLICIVLGVAVGGACYLWKPIDNLLQFALVYFVAVALALVIFLSVYSLQPSMRKKKDRLAKGKRRTTGSAGVIKKVFKRLKRAPIPAVAVLLFAAIVSVIICTLQASNEAEVKHYEETWQSVPITMSVTQLSYPNAIGNEFADWVYEIFAGEEPVKFTDVSGTGTSRKLSLAEYVKDVKVSMSENISTINGTNYTNASGNSWLIGITSLSCDKQLLPEYGCEIKWYEGYDESIFEGEDLVCIVPEKMATKRYYDNGNGEAELYFLRKIMMSVDGGPVVEAERYEYNCTLKIVGTYTAGDGKSIYCSVPIVEEVCDKLDGDRKILSLSATLADNNRLEEFREKMSFCFLEPSPDADETPWGYRAGIRYHEYYPYALDIADDNLFDLAAILEDSIKFNRTVTLIVVAISVVSGFLVGFLMIRRRKRDILLMRTVGESNFGVYLGFVIEQMIGIILGVIVGGAYNRWEPMDKLLIFAIVYFVGLTLALVIFLRSKLLTTVKEDE